MGNSCCRTESPCGSAEERSGLLKDDSKVTVAVGGAFPADNHDGIRKTPDDADIKEMEQVKQEVEQDKQEVVQVKQEVVQDKPEVMQDNQEDVQVKQEVVQLKQEVVLLKQDVVQEKQEVVQEKQDVVQEKQEVVQEKQEVVQVKQEVVQEKQEVVQGKQDVIQVKQEVVQVKQEVVQEKQEVVQDKQEVVQVKPEDVQVKQEVVQVKPDDVQVKQDVVQVKQEVVQVKPDDVQVKQEVVQVKQEVEQVKQEVIQVKQEVIQVKQEVEVTQENGPLSIGSDLKDPPPAQLLSPLTSSQEQHAAPDWAVFTTTEEEKKTPASSVQDAVPACISPTAESHVEDVTLDAPPDPEPPAAAAAAPKASWEFPPNNGESHVPNPEVSAATPRTPPMSVVGEDSESPSRAAAENSQNPRLQNGHADHHDSVKPRDATAGRSSDPAEVELVPTSLQDDVTKTLEEETTKTKTSDEDGDEPKVTEEEEDEAPVEERRAEEEEAPSEEVKEDDLENSDEDLYRGADELSSLQKTKHPAEQRCSLSPAEDIVSYSQREWRGNTAKSALIRKGYMEMSRRFGGVRRVRGDNYCALRATLFQLLAHSTRLPAWLQEDDAADTLLQHLESQDGLMSLWTFPGRRLQGDAASDVSLKLKSYMELLRNKWRAAVCCSSDAERRLLVERSFQGGDEELGLLEALKLLMLNRAVELHARMQAGDDVPLFCWLLFARDSSGCPRSFLSNHLGLVGVSAGLEQVEMFLLGDALQVTLQVFRLYKADTEEFVTFYPDDHRDEWPLVSLVTEDDRHYNVPVAAS